MTVLLRVFSEMASKKVRTHCTRTTLEVNMGNSEYYYCTTIKWEEGNMSGDCTFATY